MEVHFTPDQEMQLAQLATKAGTDAEQLVREIILRMLDANVRHSSGLPTLPVWHLEARGPLHRRDIYDDVH